MERVATARVKNMICLSARISQVCSPFRASRLPAMSDACICLESNSKYSP
jgi:hypothetical protein